MNTTRTLDWQSAFHEWLDGGLPTEKLLEEFADAHITMVRPVDLLGGQLDAEVDKKMAVNRRRKWVADGTGNGQHVDE